MANIRQLSTHVYHDDVSIATTAAAAAGDTTTSHLPTDRNFRAKTHQSIAASDWCSSLDETIRRMPASTAQPGDLLQTMQL